MAGIGARGRSSIERNHHCFGIYNSYFVVAERCAPLLKADEIAVAADASVAGCCY